MVTVLAIGPTLRELKPRGGDEFLRAIKFRRPPSFGGEVNPSAPCRKISGRVKEPFEV
jgi:hypothetical protein